MFMMNAPNGYRDSPNLPWLLRVAVSVAITVGLLSYVIMPRLTRWFKGWLFS